MTTYSNESSQIRRTFSNSWINAVMVAVNRDEQMSRRSLNFHADMHLSFGSIEYALKIQNGQIVNVEEYIGLTKPWDFSLRATEAIWMELLHSTPSPRRHSIFALMKSGDMRIEGNMKLFMQHVWPIIRIIELMRITQEEDINGKD